MEWFVRSPGDFRMGIDEAWWAPDPDKPAMVHRKSTETIIYRGPTDVTGWHRFEYWHFGQSVPLIIFVGSITYPHPFPERFHRYRVSIPRTVEADVWIIDYRRSSEAWSRQTSSSDPIPYPLWRAADRAVRDVAMVWKDKSKLICRADEVGLAGGWLNGAWRNDLFRRQKWGSFTDDLGFGWAPTLIRLPLATYQEPSANAVAPKWVCSIETTRDRFGAMTENIALQMSEVNSGAFVSPVDLSSYPTPPKFDWPVTFGVSSLLSFSSINFRRYRLTEDPLDTKFDGPSDSLWRESIWGAFIAGEPWRQNFPDRITSSKLSERELQAAFDSDVELMRMRVRIMEAQLSACENALPVCPPLDLSACPEEWVPPSDREVRIVGLPIAGIKAGDLAIRVSIEPTPDAPLLDWIATFAAIR